MVNHKIWNGTEKSAVPTSFRISMDVPARVVHSEGECNKLFIRKVNAAGGSPYVPREHDVYDGLYETGLQLVIGKSARRDSKLFKESWLRAP
jgi:hypothetical protein